MTRRTAGAGKPSAVDFVAPNDVIDVDALMTRDMVTQFGQPPYRIDLLSAIDGVTFAEVWKGASMATVDGAYSRDAALPY